jgi:hypothetical protein
MATTAEGAVVSSSLVVGVGTVESDVGADLLVAAMLLVVELSTAADNVSVPLLLLKEETTTS